MANFIKIKDMSYKYDISARTLRFYEDMGLITSIRTKDYAYRLYDEATVKRLEQVLILRKLNISIKDIRRIFEASGSEVVLDVLGKKVENIDDEVSLLHELKEIILEFVRHIEQADFTKESDVKMLYEKAKDIEVQLVNVDYNGNPGNKAEPPNVDKLVEATENLSANLPGITVVRLPSFRAITSEGQGEEFWDLWSWIEKRRHLCKNVVFDTADFFFDKTVTEDSHMICAIGDDVTEADVAPYKITRFEGGLYAAITVYEIDAMLMDGTFNGYSQVLKWLENTNFIHDQSRLFIGHTVYPHREIQIGLGSLQMQRYVPIKLRELPPVKNIKLKNERYLKRLEDRFMLSGGECEKRIRYMEEFESYLMEQGVNCIEHASVHNVVDYAEYIAKTQGDIKANGHCSIILECTEALEVFELTFAGAFISNHDDMGIKMMENLSQYAKNNLETWTEIFHGVVFVDMSFGERIDFLRMIGDKFIKSAGAEAFNKACAAAFTMWDTRMVTA